MITQEFKAAVDEKKLLRTRIMLKDSLIIDPTFTQFNEMLAYAEKKFKELLYETFDNRRLEDDESKWNEDIMNEELVCLITNFSKERIQHLIKVIKKVLKNRAEEIRSEKVVKSKRERTQRAQGKVADTNNILPKSSIPKKDRCTVKEKKMETQKQQKDIIGEKIKLMESIRCKGEWDKNNIDNIEKCAKEISHAISIYRANK